jgi:hypothetical protein
MKKNICYDEKELGSELYRIHTNLGEITGSLAMIYQQLYGDRTNLEPDYIKKTVMPQINNIIRTLNNFGVVPEIPVLDIDKNIKDLEELMKEDIY